MLLSIEDHWSEELLYVSFCGIKVYVKTKLMNNFVVYAKVLRLYIIGVKEVT